MVSVFVADILHRQQIHPTAQQHFPISERKEKLKVQDQVR